MTSSVSISTRGRHSATAAFLVVLGAAALGPGPTTAADLGSPNGQLPPPRLVPADKLEAGISSRLQKMRQQRQDLAARQAATGRSPRTPRNRRAPLRRNPLALPDDLRRQLENPNE